MDETGVEFTTPLPLYRLWYFSKTVGGLSTVPNLPDSTYISVFATSYKNFINSDFVTLRASSTLSFISSPAVVKAL